MAHLEAPVRTVSSSQPETGQWLMLRGDFVDLALLGCLESLTNKNNWLGFILSSFFFLCLKQFVRFSTRFLWFRGTWVCRVLVQLLMCCVFLTGAVFWKKSEGEKLFTF